jgi:hypothetical protein
VSEQTDWRASRWRRFEVAAIASLGYPLIAALGRTLRWRVEGVEHFEATLASSRPPILCLWHGRILPGVIYLRNRGIVVITSQNFDGEWIARIIERFGFGTARGSSSRGAVRALVQLRRDLAAGRSVAFTLDGPRGPAMRAQPGAVWLARVTGHPILPFHIEAASAWTIRSWDRTQVPKPGTVVGVCFGEPLFVAPEADDEGVERARVALEARLAALEEQARRLVGR